MNNADLIFLGRPEIQQYKADIGFKTLVESVNENMYIIPKYQRKYRWTKKQLVSLVDSLINGLPIPPVYTCRNKKGQLEILDGQQRVMSLFFYYIGSFLDKRKAGSVDFSKFNLEEDTLSNVLKKNLDMEDLHIELEDYNGKKVNVDYASLPIELKRKLDYTTITIIEIKIDPEISREDVLRKTFANLNKGGTLLSAQEQRNGIYNCAFYDMLQRFNTENKSWRDIWGNDNTKGDDVESLLHFCAIRKYARYNYETKAFVIDGYRSSYNMLLDNFSEEAMKFSSEEIAGYEDDIKEFISLFAVNRKMSRNVNLLDSFYALYHIFGIKIPITQDVCNKILKEKGYTDNSRQGTSKMNKINERWKTVYGVWTGKTITDCERTG